MANNYITDTLKDVLRHTHALGIYENILECVCDIVVSH